MSIVYRSAAKMVSPKGLPLLGHLPQFLRDKLGFLSRCAAGGADAVALRIGAPTLLLNSPEDIKHVLMTHADNYEKTTRLTGGRGRRLSGEGLLTSTGDAHLRQRRTFDLGRDEAGLCTRCRQRRGDTRGLPEILSRGTRSNSCTCR